ncbi:MAG: DUF5947 family protein, partial [Bryobacteraceae bacterium]
MNLQSQAIAGLRRLKWMNVPRERCDLCAAALAMGHRHMVDCSSRRVLCVCDACKMMLGSRTDARFRQVPEKVRSAHEIQITDAMWTRFQIPVSFAFIYTAEDEVTAIYPSPAGSVFSRVDQECWVELVGQYPILL